MEVEQLEPHHIRERVSRVEAAGPVLASSAPEPPHDLADDIDLTNIEKVRRFPHGLRR
jgi:hypothetical protein